MTLFAITGGFSYYLNTLSAESVSLNTIYANVVQNRIKERHLNNFNMGNEILKGTLIVPVVLAIVFIPYSMLIGWNLITLFLFWFVITPALTIYFPTRTSKNKNHLIESLMGLIIFYALIVYMIYEHYQSDYFQIMILSWVINVILISVVTRTNKAKAQRQLEDL